MSWPFRIKLTGDHLRWNSLKISPSDEFEEHIVANLDETSRKFLDVRRPIEIDIIDVDINESYDRVNLVKKESFWFEPFPDVRQKQRRSRSKSFPKSKCCYKPSAMGDFIDHDIRNPNARENFAYSIEPFKHIVRKRNLSSGHEIGLRCSSTTTTIKYEFSVLYAPKRDSFRP